MLDGPSFKLYTPHHPQKNYSNSTHYQQFLSNINKIEEQLSQTKKYAGLRRFWKTT